MNVIFEDEDGMAMITDLSLSEARVSFEQAKAIPTIVWARIEATCGMVIQTWEPTEEDND